MRDDQAIAMLKEGDLTGLEPLIDRYSARALRTAVLIVQDYGLAEDVVQAAFIQAATKIRQLNSDSFGTWFLKIVVHSAVKTAKSQSRMLPLEDDENPLFCNLRDWLIDRQPLPEDLLVTAEFRNAVWSALSMLKPEVRAIVIMKYYLKMSEREIMQNVGNPLTTVKWRLYTARKILRSLLKSFKNGTVSVCNEEVENENE